MDLSFARRSQNHTVGLDLAGLLAVVSARQAATPTAQAHARLTGRASPETAVDSMLCLLSGEIPTSIEACGTASFADTFNPRQPK